MKTEDTILARDILVFTWRIMEEWVGDRNWTKWAEMCRYGFTILHSYACLSLIAFVMSHLPSCYVMSTLPLTESERDYWEQLPRLLQRGKLALCALGWPVVCDHGLYGLKSELANSTECHSIFSSASAQHVLQLFHSVAEKACVCLQKASCKAAETGSRACSVISDELLLHLKINVTLCKFMYFSVNYFSGERG